MKVVYTGRGDVKKCCNISHYTHYIMLLDILIIWRLEISNCFWLYSNLSLIMVYYSINKPINSTNIAGGVLSEEDPSMKVATQTTFVPLYTGMAGMVRVSTNVPPPSLIEPAMTSEYRVLRVPLINQLMKASDR